MITGKNYIGNQVSAKGNKTFKTFNPELDQENDTVFVEATPDEIDEAVSLASIAFKEYSKISGAKKAASKKAAVEATTETSEAPKKKVAKAKKEDTQE